MRQRHTQGQFVTMAMARGWGWLGGSVCVREVGAFVMIYLWIFIDGRDQEAGLLVMGGQIDHISSWNVKSTFNHFLFISVH